MAFSPVGIWHRKGLRSGLVVCINLVVRLNGSAEPREVQIQMTQSAGAPEGPRGDVAPDTRERILDAALAAFTERGYDGATTRAIAAEAGVNLGLIPYYFGGKEGLWREAVARAFDSLRLGVGDLVASAGELPDRERMELMIRSYVRFVAHHPEFVRLMHEEGKRDSERMHWLVDHHVRPLFEAVCGMIEREGFGRAPEDTDPMHLYYVLAGAVGVLFHQAPECERLTGINPLDEAVIEKHADVLVHLLLGPPTERDTKGTS